MTNNVLLLTTPQTYRAQAFHQAARRLGIHIQWGVDLPPALVAERPDALALDFNQVEAATTAIVTYAQERPLTAILAMDDSGALLAAQAGQALGLPHNHPQAALAARDKEVMRRMLVAAGAPSPPFHAFTLADDRAGVADIVQNRIGYPCVLKPTKLSGSRGVMRANNRAELLAGIQRLQNILLSTPTVVTPTLKNDDPAAKAARPATNPGAAAGGGNRPAEPHSANQTTTAKVNQAAAPSRDSTPSVLQPGTAAGDLAFLVEAFIPGHEVAFEGLLDNGQLLCLALFDKPDPLDGPFFEETIYVTPSRLPAATQTAITAATAAAAAACGLQTGPVHAELRVNESGAWIVEIAGRSIGGLCSQTLRFDLDTSLEELILRQATGHPLGITQREDAASGVMMIPIPGAGLLRQVDGVTAAKSVPGIEDVEITARLNYPLVPLPEGNSYLGFIFARGQSPATVEAALREAHGKLNFKIEPYFSLSLMHNQ